MAPMARTGTSCALLLVALLSTAGCADPAVDQSASPQPTVTVTATSTSTVTVTASPPGPTADAVDGDIASGGPTGLTGDETVATLPPPAGGSPQSLTLANFEAPNSDWEEDVFDVADRSEVRGIATEVFSCGLADSYQALEIRLRNNYERLTFQVAQSNGSQSSEQNISIEVVANGSQSYVASVPFNTVEPVDLSVTGVNALQIRVALDDRVEDCGDGSAVPVLFDLTLS